MDVLMAVATRMFHCPVAQVGADDGVAEVVEREIDNAADQRILPELKEAAEQHAGDDKTNEPDEC